MPVSKSRKKRKRKKMHGSSEPWVLGNDMPLPALVIENPPGIEKMSDLLSEFAEPYVEFASTEEDYKGLIGMAALAWNLALLPWWERKKLLNEMMNHTVPPAPPEARLLLKDLIHRKKKYFAEYSRMIVDYQVKMRRDGMYVRVKSTLP